MTCGPRQSTNQPSRTSQRKAFRNRHQVMTAVHGPFRLRSGESGIRTRGAENTPLTGLAIRRFRPLSHLSESCFVGPFDFSATSSQGVRHLLAVFRRRKSECQRSRNHRGNRVPDSRRLPTRSGKGARTFGESRMTSVSGATRKPPGKNISESAATCKAEGRPDPQQVSSPCRTSATQSANAPDDGGGPRRHGWVAKRQDASHSASGRSR